MKINKGKEIIIEALKKSNWVKQEAARLLSIDRKTLYNRMKKFNIQFYVEPYIRFKGESGEQRTFFVQDPSLNFLEFKCLTKKNDEKNLMNYHQKL